MPAFCVTNMGYRMKAKKMRINFSLRIGMAQNEV
jgi:hypothetical protein